MSAREYYNNFTLPVIRTGGGEMLNKQLVVDDNIFKAMKTKLLTLALLLLGVAAGAEVVQFSISNNCNKNGKNVDLTQSTPGEAVDLGLSVKWATCNVGATASEEYGDYFAWGETTTKGNYDWETYKYCNGNYTMLTKYCISDNKTVLDSIDDVATAKWGGEWRMPTDAEWTELRTKCQWTWTQVNGVNGYRVSASNGNYIFLPAAGFHYRTRLENTSSYGYYWSSSLDLENQMTKGFYLYFLSRLKLSDSRDRCYGLPVRPVRP